MGTPEFGSTEITGIVAKLREATDALSAVDMLEQERRAQFFAVQDERDLSRKEAERLKERNDELEAKHAEMEGRIADLEAKEAAAKEAETVEETL